MKNLTPARAVVLAIPFALAIAACGGGGGDNRTAAPTTTPDTAGPMISDFDALDRAFATFNSAN